MKAISLRFILFFITLLSAGIASAQADFRLIPPQTVIAGRNFSVTFRLSNAQASAPSAPELKGCDLLYGPSVSTMSSSQIINGRVSSSSSVDYTFMYRAKTPGEVTVPEVSVTVNGKRMTSRPATFKILAPDKTTGSQGSAGGHVSADDITTHKPGKVSPNDLFIRISFSKSKAYEQEPVLATIKVYTKYNISSFMVTQQPAFDGFLSEEMPVTLEAELENYNGQNYYSAVLKRCLLYPQKNGKLTVNSGKYELTIQQYETVDMGYFRTQRPVERQITTESNAASLIIEPLPEPKPAGFNGAVGRFTVSTDLQPELLKTNEAATYSYIIKGTGNIKYLKEPVIDFPSSIDTYTPKTDIDTHIAGANTTGTFRIDYTIVPQEVGKFTIPGTPFSYFDIDKKQYVTLDTRSYDINVARGATTSAVVEQRAIDKTIDDILHIKPSGENQFYTPVFVFNKLYYWLAFVVVIMILIGVVIVYRRRLKFNADISGKKLARANRVAVKRLKQARAFMNAHENEKFYAELSKAMWGYLSDKLGIAPSQLVRDNIAQKLQDFGARREDIDNIIDVLDQCEMARFTPSHTDSEVSELYSRAGAAIKGLEDVKKR